MTKKEMIHELVRQWVLEYPAHSEGWKIRFFEVDRLESKIDRHWGKEVISFWWNKYINRTSHIDCIINSLNR